jgi:hypothetical protein
LGVGSRLALFALALQIVFSFGHVHLGDFKHGGRGVAVAGTPAGPSAPTQQPVSDADNYCATSSISTRRAPFQSRAPPLA